MELGRHVVNEFPFCWLVVSDVTVFRLSCVKSIVVGAPVIGD